MSEYSIPYGKTTQKFNLPRDWQVSVLKPEAREALKDPVQAVMKSLVDLGTGFDSQGIRKTVAIAINDKTRPVPHGILLPPLLSWLEQRGYQPEDITLIIATGTHTPMPPEEHHLIVPGNIDDSYRIISHDALDRDSLVDLGVTSSGTPCIVNRIFVESDLRIVVGNIEPHQYMGWSGGVKSAAIGLGGNKSITANHSMLSREGAGPCRFADNPVRQDVEEMGRLIGIHLALNVVMNEGKEIVAVFTGDPESVMKRGIDEAQSLFTVTIDGPADLVITAAGGYPKDINLYQTQKALRHASAAAKPGAPMVLAGACPEGIGSVPYETWMKGKTSHEQVRESFSREDFKLGPHKAMQFAVDAMDREVLLVSEIPEETVRRMLLEPAHSVQEAVDGIRKNWKSEGRPEPIRVAILPYGNATVPVVGDSRDLRPATALHPEG